jgi:hypothetical protein
LSFNHAPAARSTVYRFSCENFTGDFVAGNRLAAPGCSRQSRDGYPQTNGPGGGRIAICTPTNNFAVTTNINGGDGVVPGASGTLFLSANLPGFQAVSQSPTGTVNNTVGFVDLIFCDALDPASVSASAFAVSTPAGTLDATNLSATVSGISAVRVSFPPQNLLGDYTLQMGTTISNLFGLPLTQAYSGVLAVPCKPSPGR